MTTLNAGLMLSMLAIAGLFAGGFLTMAPFAVYAEDEESTEIEVENEAKATNEDNDEVEQRNEAAIVQEGGDCAAGASVSDDDFIGVTGANVAAASNDCDNTQSATIGQANVNTDNDVQVASADACQQVASLVGFSIC